MKDITKDYRNILIIIKENLTNDSKHNKLLKIQYETEDYTLKELLEKVINQYGERRTTYSYKYWDEVMEPLKRALNNYCESILRSKKPQWQILAEQNGWGPIR